MPFTLSFKKRKAAKEARQAAEKQARLVKQLTDLLDRAEAGDEWAQCELINKRWYSSDPVRKRRLNANEFEVRVERQYRSKLPVIADDLKALDSAVSLDEKIRAYVGLIKDLDSLQPENEKRFRRRLGLDREVLKEQLAELVQQKYEDLLSRRTEREVFLELINLIYRTRSEYDTGDLRRAGVPQLGYPDDWNDLIARHFTNPDRGQFVRLPEFAYGELRLAAADALRSDSLTQAKIVLAHCKPYGNRGEWEYWREELGDVLIAELAKMVSLHNSQLGFVESAVEE